MRPTCICSPDRTARPRNRLCTRRHRRPGRRSTARSKYMLRTAGSGTLCRRRTASSRGSRAARRRRRSSTPGPRRCLLCTRRRILISIPSRQSTANLPCMPCSAGWSISGPRSRSLRWPCSPARRLRWNRSDRHRYRTARREYRACITPPRKPGRGRSPSSSSRRRTCPWCISVRPSMRTRTCSRRGMPRRRRFVLCRCSRSRRPPRRCRRRRLCIPVPASSGCCRRKARTPRPCRPGPRRGPDTRSWPSRGCTCRRSRPDRPGTASSKRKLRISRPGTLGRPSTPTGPNLCM